ncbi:hypothetical protein SAMN02745121_07610 [Nannocystis exedens]|uniref:Tetratricopeptide repeat-containing protein n=1 Tax=Nannocystis exedens TaxID=54 RepID=A0A1I2GYV5_9BACT|nr:hypothetical protein [Nannocystis exedens]PCC68861.1 hypothetical protein NAEX_01881 [Nannocystis exedens]SFF22602.1 hypothetical protein SAMN02745121_07610 [Nannocystis exedens]
MTDEPTSRALIAAYKACARPSAAAEAELWATLAAAERADARDPGRRSPSRAPWLALAAGLLLLAAWQLDLARIFASGHVLQDMRDLAAYDAAEPDPLEARPREESAGAVRWLETVKREAETRASPGRQRAAAGHGRGSPARASRAAADEPGLAEGGDGAPGADAREGLAGDGDRVLAEMALLQEARAALRGGQPETALALLDRHAESFAGGSMTEERQALRVLALCAAGEVARGADEAAAFLRAHPRSTYAARVAAACPEGHVQKDTSEDR